MRNTTRYPWLSVIMPTCNGGGYLRHALDSIVAQQDPAVEVIVVDDGSCDDTVAIAEGYQRRLSISVHVLPHSGNWVRSSNLGIRLARGAYLSILHQDDAWRPTRLCVLKRLVAKHGDVVLFVHPCWYMDSLGRRIGYWHCPFPTGAAVQPPQSVIERLLVQCFYGVPAPMFSARAAHETGLMDEALWFCADWDFWLKLSALGKTVYCPTPLAMFRLHSTSQTVVRGRRADEVYRQQLLVQSRYMHYLAQSPVSAEVRRVAKFSTEVNAALLRSLDGEPIDAIALVTRLLGLGPSGWLRYFRDSRIVERCLSRVQAGAISWRARATPIPTRAVGSRRVAVGRPSKI